MSVSLSPTPPPVPVRLYGLLYRSHAMRGLLTADLSDILESAVHHNVSQSVTGLLVYSKNTTALDSPGLFVQWLEGSAEDVAVTYSRILVDRRHTDVEVLAANSLESLTGANVRLFPAWAMSLQRELSAPETVAGFLAYAKQLSR